MRSSTGCAFAALARGLLHSGMTRMHALKAAGSMQMSVQLQETAPKRTCDAPLKDLGWLADNALEANFTLSPEWALALARHLGGARVHQVHALADTGRPGGFMQLEMQRWRWGLPVACAHSFFGGFPISGTPLINAESPGDCYARLVDNAFTDTGAAALVLSHVSGQHAVTSALVEGCDAIDAPVRFFDDRERAALRCNGDYDTWLKHALATKKRKELRRQRKRLAELGHISFQQLRNTPGELAAWCDAFLVLESAGWKGRAHTAITNDAAMDRFVREVLAVLAARGRLRFWRLDLDGRPLAMAFGVVQGTTCGLVKIAYGETYARFSPGVQLVLDVSRALFEDEDVLFADSCAEPGHPMIDHIWKDRLRVRDVLIGRPGRSRAAFSVLAGLEGLRRSGRAGLKKAYTTFIRRGRT